MTAILDSSGKPMTALRRVGRQEYARSFRRTLNAKYDAAQTTDDNERHWANADFLSANAALRPGIRKRLRARARYEAQENNSYAKGMILTLANDLIGTGPRLQLLTKDRSANQRVEASFLRWSKEVRLAEKLRTMRLAKTVDGETFALLANNPGLMHSVQLDVKPIEADYVEAPYSVGAYTEDDQVDGLKFDTYGNVTEYHVLKEHPGTLQSLFGNTEGDWTPAEEVLHIYRQDRPGQRRGVTEIVTALPLFAMLRRFTLATVAAAETAADFAAIMHTQATAGTEAEELGKDEWFEAIPLEYRAMLTLPNGWDITQLKAEHPTTTYKMFKSEIINEIGRCLNMPFNVAAANSSEYNYASVRMDHQGYIKSIDVERDQWECSILNRIFMAWLDEAVLIPGLLPENVGPIGDWNYQWYWDGFEHVDPDKTSRAQERKLKVGTTNLYTEMAKEGRDLDTEDVKSAESMGLTVEELRRRRADYLLGPDQAISDDDDDTDTDKEDEEEEVDGEEEDDKSKPVKARMGFQPVGK